MPPSANPQAASGTDSESAKRRLTACTSAMLARRKRLSRRTWMIIVARRDGSTQREPHHSQRSHPLRTLDEHAFNIGRRGGSRHQRRIAGAAKVVAPVGILNTCHE